MKEPRRYLVTVGLMQADHTWQPQQITVQTSGETPISSPEERAAVVAATERYMAGWGAQAVGHGFIGFQRALVEPPPYPSEPEMINVRDHIYTHVEQFFEDEGEELEEAILACAQGETAGAPEATVRLCRLYRDACDLCETFSKRGSR